MTSVCLGPLTQQSSEARSDESGCCFRMRHDNVSGEDTVLEDYRISGVTEPSEANGVTNLQGSEMII